MIEEPREPDYDRLVSDDYTLDELKENINILINLGLIEVGGITPDGNWLYQTTEKANNMPIQEVTMLLMDELERQDDQ